MQLQKGRMAGGKQGSSASCGASGQAQSLAKGSEAGQKAPEGVLQKDEADKLPDTSEMVERRFRQ